MTNTTTPVLTDIKEIAKRVRADLAAAVKAGTLHAFKFSVKISRYSGGQSLRVEVVEAPDGFAINNIAHMAWSEMNPKLSSFHAPESARNRLSPAAVKALDAVRVIVAAYNWDRGDVMVDYYDVNFYSHEVFSHDLLTADRERLVAQLRTGLEQ